MNWLEKWMRKSLFLYYFVHIVVEALSLTISRAEQQVNAAVLLDRNSGFINTDTLVITMTVRVLKETETREYSVHMQVVGSRS